MALCYLTVADENDPANGMGSDKKLKLVREKSPTSGKAAIEGVVFGNDQ